MSGLALAVEQRGSELLQRTLVAAYSGRWPLSKSLIGQIRLAAQTVAAQRLSAYCDAMLTSLEFGDRAIEGAAALLRAEMDRVIFTLRECVLVS